MWDLEPDVCWVMGDYAWSHWDDAMLTNVPGISSFDDIMHLTRFAHQSSSPDVLRLVWNHALKLTVSLIAIPVFQFSNVRG